MPKTSPAKLKANAKSDKKNTVQFKMKLSINTDKDILDRLASVGNKQGYVKELIRSDIAESKKTP